MDKLITQYRENIRQLDVEIAGITLDIRKLRKDPEDGFFTLDECLKQRKYAGDKRQIYVQVIEDISGLA